MVRVDQVVAFRTLDGAWNFKDYRSALTQPVVANFLEYAWRGEISPLYREHLTIDLFDQIIVEIYGTQ